jgi:type III secretion protein T
VGYAVGIILWAIAAIGDLIDLQSGFQNAQIFNPFAGQPGGPFGALLTQIGVLLFIGYGGLHVFLQLLFESLLLWPPASFTPDLSNAVRDFSIATSGTFLEIATRLAAPVIGVLLIVELGIGLINRAAQELNTFYFSMPIKALTAILMLALMLSHLVDVVRAAIGESSGLIQKLDSVWRLR